MQHQTLPDPVFSHQQQRGLLLLPERRPHNAAGQRRMICWLLVTVSSTQLSVLRWRLWL